MQQKYLYGKSYDEHLFSLNDHVEESIQEKSTFTVEKYEIDKTSDVRWCSYFGEFIESGDCGKARCKHYSPINGVRGKCADKHFSYSKTDQKYKIDCGVVTEIKI